jgi:hypothetical protein
MNTNQQETNAVSQEEFSEFLAGLKLGSQRIRRLRVNSQHEFDHKDVKDIRHQDNYGYATAEGGHVRIDAKHTVKLIGPRRKILGSMEVQLSWYYKSEQEITDEVFEVFVPAVRFQTWPYLRELVSDVAARANWPRVMIPLLISPPPNRADDDQ